MAARPGDRVHRSVLLFLGLLLLIGGVAGLLVGAGALGPSELRRKAVFDNLIGRFLARDSVWTWPVLGVIALLVALLALRWILVQFHTSRARELDLPTERRVGRTLVAPGAVTSALTEEIEGYHGVQSASARWLGQPRDPSLHLTVNHSHDVDLPALLHRVETDALGHLRQALDRDDIPVRLDLKATQVHR